jgi:hypothetical protein
MRTFLRAAALSAALLPAGGATAAQLVVANADFSQGAPAQSGATASHVVPIAGWDGGSGAIHWNPNLADYSDEVEHGAIAFVTGALQPFATPGTLRQVIAGETIKANTRYTMTVDVGGYQFQSPFGFDFGLIAGDFGAGSFILSSLMGGGLTGGSFHTRTLVFETGAQGPAIGKQLSIALGASGSGIGYDNIRLEATQLAPGAVPEPATWAMMICGFGLAGAHLRRRRPAIASL